MFEISLIDASFATALLIALIAGFFSFLSPCVLPIVPPYLAYMSGTSLSEMNETTVARRKALFSALFFVMGLSTIFLLLGFTASLLGTLYLTYQTQLTMAAGVVIMIFGGHFIGVYRIPFLDQDMRIDAGDRGGSAFGAYVLGLAFAFGWTPCIGPQLGAILGLAASEADVARGTTLLAVYAIGLGIPFLLVAAFLPSLTGVMNWTKRHMKWIERSMGALLLIVGLMMVTGKFTDFSLWLNERFPILQTFG
ncbi:cytochrome c biogenesis CcdA family protein [Parasulfitobacter algicola]|uniref:Cytochrome c biogenesis protein CcdA n=1 Tax=Parasulfitobacter algicola TaxID=2614809 RepID=A0ABX2IUX8_9RHOB|nr:cytochrome c biogenesis protein CcdA [Sulfitobacter algicola]NSX55811.1 cytochrome c biogenesis protein CcdA [Sulfitobacter algicola]